MYFIENLFKARGNMAFMVGLCLAAGVAITVEFQADKIKNFGRSAATIQTSDTRLPLAQIRSLSAIDLEHARVAWSYFEQHTDPVTGLASSAANYPSTTIWDQASYLLALISAERIGILDKRNFDDRMTLVLSTLSELPLYDGRLPNKAYHTRTLQMTDYTNEPVDQGIGWSALDVARMAIPLRVLLYDYPDHSAKASNILTQWDLASMLREGQLMGARVDPETGQPDIVQEGRLGYEEYAARAVGLLGLDALTAGRHDDFLTFETVSGQAVGVDSRSHALFDAHNYVVSEPYILTGIEFGFDSNSAELSDRIFKAQRARHQQTGILTAVSEDNIDQEPYFLYNTVFANGKQWNTLAEDGSEHDTLRTVSTKAVFGWDALYRSDYTAQLMDHIAAARDPDGGWNSGIYEIDGRTNAVATANTNGIILEAIQYRANGPLVTSRFQRKEK